jgi:His-Xaa-Ser system protein HxsD
MDGIRAREPFPIGLAAGGFFALEIDTSIYGQRAILRTCYKLTDRCYLLLTRCAENPAILCLVLSPKRPGVDPADLAGELCNELLDQQIREDLSRDMEPLREIIAAQAFAEGNLLDPQRDDGDYEADPLGIGSSR